VLVGTGARGSKKGPDIAKALCRLKGCATTRVRGTWLHVTPAMASGDHSLNRAGFAALELGAGSVRADPARPTQAGWFGQVIDTGVLAHRFVEQLPLGDTTSVVMGFGPMMATLIEEAIPIYGSAQVPASLPGESPAKSNHCSQAQHDLFDLRREAVQRRNDFEVFRRCSLAERYVKGQLSVVLELCPKSDGLPVKVGARKRNIEPIDSPIFVLQFQAIDAHDHNRRHEEAVFVVDVEQVQGENIGVSSFVRFYVVQDEPDNGRGYWYFMVFRQHRLNSFPRPVGIDEELGVFGSGVWGYDCSPSNVESTAKIVDRVTDHGCKVGPEEIINKAVVEELFPRLGIHVQAGAVSIRRGAESLLDIRDVLVGPFDLQESIGERVSPDLRHG
jgi:hypothetical protein